MHPKDAGGAIAMATKTPVGRRTKKITKNCFDSDIQEVLFTKEDISAKIEEMAVNISRDYAGKEVILVCAFIVHLQGSESSARYNDSL